MQVDAEAQADAVTVHRRHLADHLDQDAQRVAQGKQHEGQLGVGVGQEGVGKEGGRGHEVVEDGGRGAPEVVPLRVEHAREDGRERVEDDLYDEEPEEVDREVKVKVRGCREGLRVDELCGKDEAQHRHRTHQHQDDGDQV